MSIKVNRNLRAGKIKSLDKAEIELLSESGIKDNEETLKKLKEELGNANTAATVTEEKVTVLESASAEASDTLDALAKTIALSIKQVLPEAETTANMQSTYFRDRSWFSSDNNFIRYNFTTETQCKTAPEDMGYAGVIGGKALDVPDTSFTTCANYMFNQSNYSKIPNLNTPELAEAGAMFYGCQYLKELPEMDLRNLTNGNYMFCGCSQIAKTPNYMFKNAPKAGMMFANCTNLQEVKISESNTSMDIYVTDPICMFQNCTKLSSLEKKIFFGADTTSVKGMFYGCTSLVCVPIDKRYDYNNATKKPSIIDMSYMFANCTSLTDFNEMYLYAEATDEPFPDSSLTYWTDITSTVTNMSYIFANCPSLKATPRFDCSSVTNFTGAFKNCTSLGNIRMVNIKADLDISDCHGFDYSTTYKLIHAGLAEVEETKTLTINEDTYAMMYASDIEDANAKGWTIAVK